jgi:hypothetical protein
LREDKTSDQLLTAPRFGVKPVLIDVREMLKEAAAKGKGILYTVL